MVVNAHDLLEISDLSYLQWNHDREWVISSLQNAPFVVVRRAQWIDQASIPVGIRGEERSKREPAFLHQNGIKNVFSPYQMVEQKMWNNVNASRRQKVPVFDALDQVAEVMSKWKWGITGSAGFEIATNFPTLHETSDLDIVIYAPQQIDFLEAKTLLQQIDTFDIRVDIQIEIGNGAFLLCEWINQRAKTIILRTETGPMLVSNPWSFK